MPIEPSLPDDLSFVHARSAMTEEGAAAFREHRASSLNVVASAEAKRRADEAATQDDHRGDRLP